MENKEPKYKSENALKTIDIITDGGFECNGKVYFLEPQISPERFRKMTVFELELSFATSFKKLYRDLNELRQELNKTNFVDSAVKLRDIQEGLHRLDDKRNHHPILKYCACILNTKDEDRRGFDEKMIDEKIKDWQEGGISIQSFFAVVLHSVNGLPGSYNELIRGISEKTATTPKKENPSENAQKKKN